MVYVATLVGMSLLGPALGHDEAVYALGADALLGGDGTPALIHRPVGMLVIAAPAVLAGGGDLGFRLTAMTGTLSFLAATWLFARRVTGPRTATWTVAVVATSYSVIERSTELLPDPWASALILGFATVAVARLGPDAEPARRWDLVWLGPLAAAAFYLRYGSIAVLASVGITALIVYRRGLSRLALPLLVTAVVVVVLAWPHAVHSISATGSPLGIITASHHTAGGSYPGQGLAFYATRWWLWLGPVAVVCVAAGAWSAARRTTPFAVFAGLASVLTLVELGLAAHGEARYALVPQVLCTTLGVDAIIRRVQPRPRLAVAVLAASLIGSVVIWSHAGANTTFDVAVSAGKAVHRAAGGRDCQVLASKSAQLEWYSGCRGTSLGESITPHRLRPTATTFVVWFDSAPRQPPQVLDDLLAARHGVRAIPVARIEHAGRWGGATIYRLAAP